MSTLWCYNTVLHALQPELKSKYYTLQIIVYAEILHLLCVYQTQIKGLPDDFAGPIRMINIEGVDANMCCGTHVTNLSQLQVHLKTCTLTHQHADMPPQIILPIDTYGICRIRCTSSDSAKLLIVYYICILGNKAPGN